MADLGETVGGRGPGAQRWRVGCDPVRVLGFDLLELVQQPVEFQVADHGCIQHVIPVIMEMDLLFQIFVAGFFDHA